MASAALLLVTPIAGSKAIYRRTNVAVPEGWVFVGAAVVLTVAGAVLDAGA